MISQSDLEDFQQIMLDDYGVSLDVVQSEEVAKKLTDLMIALLECGKECDEV